jgi:purine-nucleoside/S-methyl-5'-thioadenosine phosphorylase / adenosine deaminase
MIVSMKPQLAANFEWVDAGGRRALVCGPLAAYARHLFTTREWALGSVVNGDDPAAWSAVAAALDVSSGQLVRLHQVHGASVLVKRRGAPLDATVRPAADIVITDNPDVALSIQTADCVPLLIVDPINGAVGAAHAGWRGLASGVPGVAVAAMQKAFGSRPGDLLVAVGPSISAARYEVGEDVRSQFMSAFGAAELSRWFPQATRPSHWQFDGWTSTRDQLEAAGVLNKSIYMSNLCTAASPELFCSYRRDGRPAGRMAAAIRAGRGDWRVDGGDESLRAGRFTRARTYR